MYNKKRLLCITSRGYCVYQEEVTVYNKKRLLCITRRGYCVQEEEVMLFTRRRGYTVYKKKRSYYVQ